MLHYRYLMKRLIQVSFHDIANRYQAMLQTLDIDVIKRMEGEFDVDEIISTFQNFFFQRMILDITAIKNYKNIETLQKLATSLDMEKVIVWRHLAYFERVLIRHIGASLHLHPSTIGSCSLHFVGGRGDGIELARCQ